MDQLSSCEHPRKTTSNQLANCLTCGSYIHPHNRVVKTVKHQTVFHTSNTKYLSSLRKRSGQICFKFTGISDQVFSLLQSICKKFQFGTETLALGIYLYSQWQDIQKKPLDVHGDFFSNRQSVQTESEIETGETYNKFISSVCLIVAAKAVQLDKRVPYLNRYQRYAETSKTQEEYQKQEQKICDGLNFKFQYPTFITFVNFFLATGFLFEVDKLSKTQVRLIQEDLNKKAKEYLKDGSFVRHQPQKLAMKVVYETRDKFSLEEKPKQLLMTLSQSSARPSLQLGKLDRRNIENRGESGIETLRGPQKDYSHILQPLKTDRNSMGSQHYVHNSGKSFQMKYITMRNRPKRQILSNRPPLIKENQPPLSLGLENEKNIQAYSSVLNSIKLKEKDVYQYIATNNNSLFKNKPVLTANNSHSSTIKHSVNLENLLGKRQPISRTGNSVSMTHFGSVLGYRNTANSKRKVN